MITRRAGSAAAERAPRSRSGGLTDRRGPQKPGHDGHAGERPRELRRDEAGHVGGAIPAKVAVSPRAIVTAGLAKEVEAVNQ
jgi:hypothetical protein